MSYRIKLFRSKVSFYFPKFSHQANYNICTNKQEQVDQIIESRVRPTSETSTKHRENLTNAFQKRESNQTKHNDDEQYQCTESTKTKKQTAKYEITKNIQTYIPEILLEKSSHQSKGRGWESGEVAEPFSSTFPSAFLFLFSPLMGPIGTQKPR